MDCKGTHIVSVDGHYILKRENKFFTVYLLYNLKVDLKNVLQCRLQELFSNWVLEEVTQSNCSGKSDWKVFCKQVLVYTFNCLFDVVWIL